MSPAANWSSTAASPRSRALAALDEFNDVAVRVFDHGNGRPRPYRGFGPGEFDALGFQPLDDLVQVGDHKG